MMFNQPLLQELGFITAFDVNILKPDKKRTYFGKTSEAVKLNGKQEIKRENSFLERFFPTFFPSPDDGTSRQNLMHATRA